MRLGPIAVPAAIVAALFMIIGAEAGWFDASAPEPRFVRADGAARRAGATPGQAARSVHASADPSGGEHFDGKSSGSKDGNSSATNDDVPAIGRSVGPNASPAGSGPTLGSGGASLDADGIASAGPQELVRQAREEAAKAKQDVVDVTRASLDAQHASEAEFARQRDELNDRIAKTAGELEQVRNEGIALKQQLARAPVAGDEQERLRRDVAQSEVAARAVAEALARSRDSEARLRAELAGLGRDSERKIAAANDRGKATADALAARETALKAGAADLARAEDAAAAERGKADASRAEANAMRIRAASLSLALAVEANGAARLREAAAASKRHENALGLEIADLRSQNTADADRSRADASDAVRKATEKAATMGEALDRSQKFVRELQTQVAALSAKVATAQDASTTQPAAFVAVGRSAHEIDTETGALATRLKSDLDGARRGEETLRRENQLLQRQLSEARASGRATDEKLAALQAGAGQDEPEPRAARATRRVEPRASASPTERARMVRELEALRREQMHVELQGLKIEADGLAAHRGRNARAPVSKLHVAPPRPAAALPAQEARRNEARRGDASADVPVGVAASRASALGRAPAIGSDDARATIAQARTMIRNGQLDQARRMLSQHGGAAATRALADSYNPLTNTDYGAIGVDSDADKAAYLYQQAGRMAVRDR